MYSFTGLPATSSRDLVVYSAPTSSQQLSRDAFLGSLVREARRNRRKTSSLRLGKRQPTQILSVLATR